jgi:putative SOS response-associated peptidase YedK
MCGRIAQSEPSVYAQRLDAIFGAAGEWKPSWNIGPTAPLLGVRMRKGERVLDSFGWGLLPGWCKDPAVATKSFNARSESAASKPMFKNAFFRRRLLVPVDGFYEWTEVAPRAQTARLAGRARKQPYYFQRADGDTLVLAGLWEWWARGDDARLTATVLTSAAGPDMTIHDRQPAVLDPDMWERWLDPDYGDRAALQAMLHPRGGVLVHYAVTPDVGSVRNDGPYLVEPIPEAPVDEAG